MITNTKILEKYCTDYKNIENYEEAVKSPLRYDLHHRREISENKSKKQLIAENLYYGRPPEELIFIEAGEHMRLHSKGVNHKCENNPMFGKNMSAETRKKMSNAKKNMSAETRQRMSEAHKGKPGPNRGKAGTCLGKHWHLENCRRIYTD
jgi:hypothetical protein